MADGKTPSKIRLGKSGDGAGMKPVILVIDDDPVQRRLLQAAIQRMGHETRLAGSGEEALDWLRGNPTGAAAIVLDLVMPGLDGLAVLGRLQEMGIAQPVIVQTAQGSIETVVSAMRAGAFDFVVKPVSPDRLETAVNNAIRVQTHSAAPRAREVKGQPMSFGDIVCSSPAMTGVLRIAEKAAGSQIPVLIEGETGVGKELIARAIQGTSARRTRPFVTVNCGALPENLVESLLFGHEKGAFTGASDKHVGKFEEANGGTLFLDEVGELPADIQVKLLRAIQEGEIDPIGARRPVRIDVRIISATNRDLAAEVRAGRFREDLFYRLNVLSLTVPPLRARREDVPALIRHFITRLAADEKKPHLTRIEQTALDMLCAYDWPGNIRQLENAIFRAVVLCVGKALSVAEFPQIAAQLPGFSDAEAARPVAAYAETPPVAVETQQAVQMPAPAVSAAMDGWGVIPIVGADGQVRQIEDMEAELIRFAIKLYRGRMSEVARRLGIGRSTLYRKLRDYDLEEGAADEGDDADRSSAA
jgi:DNA-binding NtrC family response regulator